MIGVAPDAVRLLLDSSTPKDTLPPAAPTRPVGPAMSVVPPMVMLAPVLLMELSVKVTCPLPLRAPDKVTVIAPPLLVPMLLLLRVMWVPALIVSEVEDSGCVRMLALLSETALPLIVVAPKTLSREPPFIVAVLVAVSCVVPVPPLMVLPLMTQISPPAVMVRLPAA